MSFPTKNPRGPPKTLRPTELQLSASSRMYFSQSALLQLQELLCSDAIVGALDIHERLDPCKIVSDGAAPGTEPGLLTLDFLKDSVDASAQHRLSACVRESCERPWALLFGSLSGALKPSVHGQPRDLHQTMPGRRGRQCLQPWRCNWSNGGRTRHCRVLATNRAAQCGDSKPKRRVSPCDHATEQAIHPRHKDHTKTTQSHSLLCAVCVLVPLSPRDYHICVIAEGPGCPHELAHSQQDIATSLEHPRLGGRCS